MGLLKEDGVVAGEPVHEGERQQHEERSDEDGSEEGDAGEEIVLGGGELLNGGQQHRQIAEEEDLEVAITEEGMEEAEGVLSGTETEEKSPKRDSDREE